MSSIHLAAPEAQQEKWDPVDLENGPATSDPPTVVNKDDQDGDPSYSVW
jgi:hypothetical protein